MTRTTSSPVLLRSLVVAIAAAATLVLSACGRDDARTAGQQLDAAIAKTEAVTDQAAAEIRQQGAEAKAAIERSADRAEAAVDRTAAQVAKAAEDARITASIQAELAKDPGLSALKIDVDTRGGQVLLQGKAPTSADRERATTLAANVKGVSSVENRLVVGS